MLKTTVLTSNKNQQSKGGISEKIAKMHLYTHQKKRFVLMDMRSTYLDGLDVHIFMKIWPTPVD